MRCQPRQNQTCSNCVFWASLGNGLGECDVTHAPEPVVRMIVCAVAEADGLRTHTPIPETNEGNYSADLLTPGDHFCACWQPRQEGDRS
jgi:hypothetical protein